MIIGLSGLAGSGKDSFFQILSEKMGCSRISLGDSLKSHIKEECIKKYNIDPTSCSRDEKEIIRPFLVSWARKKREESGGRFWINSVEGEINKIISQKKNVVITDIRYTEYLNDELYWLKRELGGILVHISLYEWYTDVDEGAKVKMFLEAPNEDEKRNDPVLRENADYNIEWEKFKGTKEKIKLQMGKEVDTFIDWLSLKSQVV